MAEINFAKLKELAGDSGGSDIEVLPAGDYNVVVRSAKEKTSSNGNTYLSIFYKVVDGPYKEDGKVFSNMFFADNTPAFITARNLQALTELGAGSLLSGSASLEDVGDAIVGATATITIDAKADKQGTMRNNVTTVKNGQPVAAASSDVFGGETTFAATGTDPF